MEQSRQCCYGSHTSSGHADENRFTTSSKKEIPGQKSLRADKMGVKWVLFGSKKEIPGQKSFLTGFGLDRDNAVPPGHRSNLASN
jgi:hypothetical protein